MGFAVAERVAGMSVVGSGLERHWGAAAQL
jgi:hypothetical protein